MEDNKAVEKTRLVELSQEIKLKHSKLSDLAKSAVELAIEMGELLCEAKALTKKEYGWGKWGDWVYSHTRMSQNWADRLISLYEYAPKLNLNSNARLRLTDFTIPEIEKMIRDFRRGNSPTPPPPPNPKESDYCPNDNFFEQSQVVPVETPNVDAIELDDQATDIEEQYNELNRIRKQAISGILRMVFSGSRHPNLVVRLMTAFRAFVVLVWIEDDGYILGDENNRKPSLRELSRKLNVSHNTLSKWAKKFEADFGLRCRQMKSDTACRKYSDHKHNKHWRRGHINDAVNEAEQVN